MPRDNEHKTYKEKWACFRCRKCFKQRSTRELAREKRLEPGEKRVVLCPQCREPMQNMGWDFKVPRQKDIEQWKKAELLVKHGYDFYSWCLWDEPHKGPGPRPSRLRDVEPFLKAKAAERKQ